MNSPWGLPAHHAAGDVLRPSAAGTLDDERRRGARVPLSAWVEQSWRAGVVLRRAMNLGEGGVCFLASLPEPAGTELELGIPIPDGRAPVRARGVVVGHADDDHRAVSIRFTRISPRDRGRVAAYVRALAA